MSTVSDSVGAPAYVSELDLLRASPPAKLGATSRVSDSGLYWKTIVRGVAGGTVGRMTSAPRRMSVGISGGVAAAAGPVIAAPRATASRSARRGRSPPDRVRRR